MLDTIWYEKYRPKKLKDMVLDKSVRLTFKKYIKNKEIPHLLFYGPAGAGKTTLARILIRNLAQESLIMNASSEDRGVNIIKTKVRQFASGLVTTDFKRIVFFDEANGLTYDAQEALKNTIEAYHTNCRFIFTTNQIDKITNPIQSRCTLFKFDSLPIKDVITYCGNILEEEEVSFKKRDVKKIVKTFYPDMRSIINNIQYASSTGALRVDEIAFLDSKSLKLMTNHLKSGRFLALRGLIVDGSNDFTWAYRWLFNDFVPKHIPQKEQAAAAITVAEYMYRDRTVVDKEINLSACFLEMMDCLNVEINFDEPF